MAQITLRRSTLEQRMDVLAAIAFCNKDGQGAKPTHVMYHSNLSWMVMTQTLAKLEELGFVNKEQREHGRTFFLTTRGLDMLERYRQLSADTMDGENTQFNLLQRIRERA